MSGVEKVGVAGAGALGSIVIKALKNGLDGYGLHAVSDISPKEDHGVPNLSFKDLVEECDVIVECLPAAAAKDLAEIVLSNGKTMVMISSCALVLYPELNDKAKGSKGRIIVPSGALSGLDAVAAMAANQIDSAKIMSVKPPKGFKGAPYLIQKNIDPESITERTLIFSGNVFEAAKAFPANVNVAASLSLAGIGPEHTAVEVWADPAASGNSHEIVVSGPGSVVRSKIENVPDPSNPKSSMQAGFSIVSALEKRKKNLTIF